MSHASVSASSAVAVFCSLFAFATVACGPAATTDPPTDPQPAKHVPAIDSPSNAPNDPPPSVAADGVERGAPSIDGTPSRPHPTGIVHVVQVSDSGFSPASLSLSLGDTVQFDFLEGAHTATSGFSCRADGMFESGSRESGQNYRVTFLRTGVFPFYSADDCERMKGALLVKN